MNDLEIIDEIQKIRSKNNVNWMDILRIAFSHAPDEAAKVLAEIYKEDKKLNNLAKQLTKNI